MHADAADPANALFVMLATIIAVAFFSLLGRLVVRIHRAISQWWGFRKLRRRAEIARGRRMRW